MWCACKRVRGEGLEPSVRIQDYETHKQVHGATEQHVIKLVREQRKWEPVKQLWVHVKQLWVHGMPEELELPLLQHVLQEI